MDAYFRWSDARPAGRNSMAVGVIAFPPSSKASNPELVPNQKIAPVTAARFSFCDKIWKINKAMEKLPPQPEGNDEQNKKETEPETHANFRERSKQFLREISDAGPGNPFNTDDPRDAETVRMLTRVFRALEERTNVPINDEREEIDGYKFFTDATRGCTCHTC